MIKILMLFLGIAIGVILTVLFYYSGQKLNDPDMTLKEFIDLSIEVLEDLVIGRG